MLMNDAINQIAIEADKRRYGSYLSLCIGPYGYNLLKPEEKEEKLSPERFRELDQQIRTKGRLSTPRLSIDEINTILADYPYKLPIEFYDLYQRGNGVMPIGLGDKDWDCYNNYFQFPFIEMHWKQLHESMDLYRYILEEINKGWFKVEPTIFPLMEFERRVFAIVGSDIQQPTSPVFSVYAEDMEHNKDCMTILWNSLTEMIIDGCSKPEA
jgi:hypothetical protein